MSALDRVPGLAGFLSSRDRAAQKEAGDLQKAQAVTNLQGALEKRRRVGRLQEVLAASGGDPAKAMPMLLAAGDIEGAATLSQIAETQRKASLPQPGQSIGAGGLRLPDGTVVPPSVRPETPRPQTIGAGGLRLPDGTIVPPVMRPREPREAPAPSLTEIVDPKNPKRMLRINARTFNEQKYMAGDNTGVIGFAGKEPAAAKAEEDKSKGKNQISTLVDSLAADYGILQKRGDLVDPKKTGMSNIYERAAASGLGQAVAGTVGTQAQQVRDRIKTQRPLLMAAIKQASGMSAQQMNSNAELQFYMQAATDVTMGYETNIAALSHLDRTYGVGTGVQANPQAVAALAKLAKERGVAPAAGPARISSDAEYEALPSGTEFIAPDGSRRKKP